MNGIWIRADERPAETHFYYFKKKITAGKENALVIDVSADTRYQLYINGALCSEGPCMGSWYQKYYETVDCSDKLVPGENDITVKVLFVREGAFISTFKKDRPALWLTARFTCDGEERDFRSDKSWECLRDDSVSFVQGRNVTGSIPEFESHAAQKRLTRVGVTEWYEANTAAACFFVWGVSEQYLLRPRPIPQMQTYPAKPFRLCGDGVLDAGKYTTAKVKFAFRAAAGVKIRVTYAECRLTPDGNGGYYKDKRDEAGGALTGNYDEVEANGGVTVLEPFWYRAFRFVKIEADGEFEIADAEYAEYFYPMDDIARFACSDPELNAMWDVSLNTVRCCMHEIFVDCPYYEQQQYDMDSTLEALFTYRFIEDTAMQKKCITDLSHSQLPDGMIQANYPSTLIQVIPGFSLFFIFMIRDYMDYVGDAAFVRGLTGCIERVLEGFRSYEDERGLFGTTPYWPFVDWVPTWGIGIPEGGTKEPLTVTNLMYSAALIAAAEIYEYCGKPGAAQDLRSRAQTLNAAVRKYCYDEEKGLYRNTPSRREYSEHTTLWAILSGAVTGEEAKALMERTLRADAAHCSFSMNHYMFRALERSGCYEYADRLLDGWRKMLDMHCTSWCENPDKPRSECHGWSSAPAYEFSAMVLGVKPASPGFRTVRIEPYPGTLTWAEGEVPTPYGRIRVKWRKEGEEIKLDVSLPEGVTRVE